MVYVKYARVALACIPGIFHLRNGFEELSPLIPFVILCRYVKERDRLIVRKRPTVCLFNSLFHGKVFSTIFRMRWSSCEISLCSDIKASKIVSAFRFTYSYNYKRIKSKVIWRININLLACKSCYMNWCMRFLFVYTIVYTAILRIRPINPIF